MGDGKISAHSAGSHPSGEVFPATLEQLMRRDINVSELRSESWDAHQHLTFDAVITVCDSAAGEPCPLWLGDTTKAHWGLPDPSKIDDTAQQDAAFAKVIDVIERRIKQLLAHDPATLSADALQSLLERIGDEEL